jgi:hypothetical protein
MNGLTSRPVHNLWSELGLKTILDCSKGSLGRGSSAPHDEWDEWNADVADSDVAAGDS